MELGEVAMLLDRIVKNCNELSARDREDLTRISIKFSIVVAEKRIKLMGLVDENNNKGA